MGVLKNVDTSTTASLGCLGPWEYHNDNLPAWESVILVIPHFLGHPYLRSNLWPLCFQPSLNRSSGWLHLSFQSLRENTFNGTNTDLLAQKPSEQWTKTSFQIIYYSLFYQVIWLIAWSSGAVTWPWVLCVQTYGKVFPLRWSPVFWHTLQNKKSFSLGLKKYFGM